jgi:myosin heavy subunit
VSGESGAGKTETNKHLISYLRWRAGGGSGGGGSRGGGGERISRVLGVANVLLEALGNAKTTNNKNSSRFGKYLELAFSSGMSAGGSAAFEGARLKTFLLEKSRVVRQAGPERNYHVFYLLAAAPAALRAPLGVRAANDHAYTCAHTECAGDDGARFAELQAALQAALPQAGGGGGDALAASLFGALGAVLHLGDVAFEGGDSQGGDEGGGCAPTDAGAAALRRACGLMGIEEGELGARLTQRLISVGRDDVTIPLEPAAASSARDALSKALYQRVFAHVVQCLNGELDAASAADEERRVPEADPAQPQPCAGADSHPDGGSSHYRESGRPPAQRAWGTLQRTGGKEQLQRAAMRAREQAAAVGRQQGNPTGGMRTVGIARCPSRSSSV